MRHLPGDKGRMPEGHQEASKPSAHLRLSDAENRLSGAFMDDWRPDHESHGAGLGKVCTGDTLMMVGLHRVETYVPDSVVTYRCGCGTSSR